MAESTLNYDYVLQRALSATSKSDPRILDYGCGQGQLIALTLRHNVDIWGVDVFGADTSDCIFWLQNGRIPFDDESFDVVVSNQVFEHIADPPVALNEIERVLKSKGTFLALFPDDTVWFEGHVGLYFVHWLLPYPRFLRLYLTVCHKLGFGYFRSGKSTTEWVDWVFWLMRTDVFYHSKSDVQRWWQETFGQRPESLASDWMQFRIAASPRLRIFSNLASRKWLAGPLGFICRVRAGLVLKIKKEG
jgi:SAM-dependent methyltransferase